MRGLSRRNSRGRQSRARDIIPDPGFVGLVAGLTADLGIGPKEVATAVALIRSEREDLIAAVMAGRYSARGTSRRREAAPERRHDGADTLPRSRCCHGVPASTALPVGILHRRGRLVHGRRNDGQRQSDGPRRDRARRTWHQVRRSRASNAARFMRRRGRQCVVAPTPECALASPLCRNNAWRKATFLPLADPTTGALTLTFIAITRERRELVGQLIAATHQRAALGMRALPVVELARELHRLADVLPSIDPALDDDAVYFTPAWPVVRWVGPDADGDPRGGLKRHSA